MNLETSKDLREKGIEESPFSKEILDNSITEKIDNNLQKIDKTSNSSTNYDEILEKCREFSRTGIREENLEEFTLNFAKNCSYLGIPQNVSETYSFLKFQLSQNEISDYFEQVYFENSKYFGKVADIASLQEWKITYEESNVKEFSSTFISPPIPDWIFEKLPNLLKKTCAIFENKRERDVFFTGALGVLSGCLPNTSGVYFGSTVYPNLYGLIIAPPASGKGVLKYSKALAAQYHNNVVAESKKLKREYEDKLEIFKRNRRGNIVIKPEQPPYKVVFIPANTSLSMLVNHLVNNDGKGIICESEADTMGNTNKQEWSNYSPLLRAAFQNESYSLSRKINNEYLEVLEPKISVVLTGTPSQLSNLIKSVEDGLFSRFIFYSYTSEPVWNDPSKLSSMNLNDYFKKIGGEVCEMVQYLNNFPTKVNLTLDQWYTFNSKFKKLLTEFTFIHGDDMVSVLRRLALVTYRICMILTALNKVENGNTTEELVCSDEDFFISLAISEIYLQHSIQVYQSIPKREVNENKRSKLWSNILNELPNEFERKDATALEARFNLSVRSIDSKLQQEDGKSIEKVSNGKFRKL